MESEVFFPMVSIIIPVYNGADYLREAIDSALSQTYSNLEVIVVNDGSCDNGATEQIALSYGNKIRYFRKENGGVSSALNLGINQMTGMYFSWLSHDDKYNINKIANSVKYLSGFRDREHMIALCGSCHINEKSEIIRNAPCHFEKNVVYSGQEVNSVMLEYGVVNGCCLLIPKCVFSECGYFHEGLRYNQDALMWHQIFSHGYRLIAAPEQRDVMYRLHANQTSKTRRDLLIRDSLEMTKIIAPEFAKQSTKKHPLLRMYAKRNARQYCVDAVNECILVGRQMGVFRLGDILYLRLWTVMGKVRTILKKLYHHIAFKTV